MTNFKKPLKAAFPTPFDDCLAGAKYLVKHADDYNIDVKEIVLVGNSFGAQIAASMAFTNGNLFKVNFSLKIYYLDSKVI